MIHFMLLPLFYYSCSFFFFIIELAYLIALILTFVVHLAQTAVSMLVRSSDMVGRSGPYDLG